jgi:hypothetical protein
MESCARCRFFSRPTRISISQIFKADKLTAVSQLLYPEVTAAKWHFPQENAIFRGSNKGTFTVEPL